LAKFKPKVRAVKQPVVSQAAAEVMMTRTDRLPVEALVSAPEQAPQDTPQQAPQDTASSPSDTPPVTQVDETVAQPPATQVDEAVVQSPATQVVAKVVQPPAGSKVRPLKRAAPVAVPLEEPALEEAPEPVASIEAEPEAETETVASPTPVPAPAPVKGRALGQKNKRSLRPMSTKVSTPAVETKLETNLAKQPPRALNSPIRIFQIYFEPWQRELLDPAFYPLDNSRGSSELMEFAVFEQLQKNAATEGATLWGALSWRFGEKTGMLGSDWVKQILDHPGHDVYFCNPHTHNEAIFHNMWLQGETSHPNFLDITRAFFQAAGLDEKEIMSIHPSSIYSAANYFVATPEFWARFIPYVRKVLVTADKKLPPMVRDVLHSKVADDKGLHGGATYIPFIVERLFGLFMRTEAKDLKGYKIALPERERELNVHLKLLREMKDVAHRTQSAWLAACWVNYRNLYLSQTNTKAWCDKYLRAITPTEVRFV